MGSSRGVIVRNSSIQISFTRDGKQEKRTLTSNGLTLPPTPANIAYAERVASEIREKIRLGHFHLGDYFPEDADPVTLRTFSDQLEIWLQTKRVAASTLKGYASCIKFWRDSAHSSHSEQTLGELQMAKVTHTHLLYVIADRDDVSPKTIKNCIGPLREAMALAQREGVIRDDPSVGIKPPKIQKPVPDPFDRDEAEEIMAQIAKKNPGQVANLVETWFWTGMRTSEIFGLRWANVDLRKGYIRVKEALVQGDRKNTTKTGVERDVKLNSRALAAIQAQRQHTQAAGREVFQDPRTGSPWTDERSFRRSFWTPALKICGIRYRRPYTMRHTFATIMLMSNANPAFAAKQLGHGIEMFLKTYSIWIDGKQNDIEMMKIESAIGENVTKKESTS